MERRDNLANLRTAILGDPSRLRFVIRFSNCPRIHNESVAEHSFYTALYTYVIGSALCENGSKINLGVALSRALMHDLDECFSGDFIRMFKHSNPILKKEIDGACKGFMSGFAEKLGNTGNLSRRYFLDWNDSKLEMEGRLVAFADYLSVLSYIHQEIDLGNHRMERQLPELKKFHDSFCTLDYSFLDKYIAMSAKILDEIESSIKERQNESTKV